MKINQLLENEEGPKTRTFYEDHPVIWNYIIFNSIWANFGKEHWVMKKFMEYLNGPGKDVELQGIGFLESDHSIYREVRQEGISEFQHVKIAGDTVSFDGYGYAIYCYDYLGKPPFKFANEEFNSFAIYKNCETLTELPDWIPPYIWSFQIGYANIHSLKGIEKIIKRCGQMTFTDTPIKSHILGIAKIEGIDSVEFDFSKELTNIMNQHIHDPNPNGSDDFKIDIFELQSDLIDAGFSEYAKL